MCQAALVICSSEGGLFEYGSDEDIVANLRALRAYTTVAVVGSVTRADELAQRLRQTGAQQRDPGGCPFFASWKANWRVSRVVERPFSDQIVMV